MPSIFNLIGLIKSHRAAFKCSNAQTQQLNSLWHVWTMEFYTGEEKEQTRATRQPRLTAHSTLTQWSIHGIVCVTVDMLHQWTHPSWLAIIVTYRMQWWLRPLISFLPMPCIAPFNYESKQTERRCTWREGGGRSLLFSYLFLYIYWSICIYSYMFLPFSHGRQARITAVDCVDVSLPL